MKISFKNIFLVCFSLLSLFTFNMSVKANSFDVVQPIVDNCSLLGDVNVDTSPAYWLNWILNLMKYIAIIALLVLVTMDFLTALVQNDKDALKKAGTKAIKRFVYCVILFFVPNIVNFLLNLFGISGGCNIEGVSIVWLKVFGI